MAQKRMIDKKISVSEQVDNLSVEEKLIYTWSIPHTDDLGLLPYSHKTLKALLIPMWDMRLDSFGNHMKAILKQGLYEIFKYKGERFYRLINFFNHQTLKKDRNPNTYLNDVKSWDDANKLGFQLETNGNPREEKRKEVKLKEEKRKEISSSFEKNLRNGLKPTYDGQQMRLSNGRAWVIPADGSEWTEFVGDIKKDIVWK